MVIKLDYVFENLGARFLANEDVQAALTNEIRTAVSLENALGYGRFEGGAPNAALYSGELGLERLKQLGIGMLNAEDDQDEIQINGDVYVLETDKLTLLEPSR